MTRTEYDRDETGKAIRMRIFDDNNNLIKLREIRGGQWVTVYETDPAIARGDPTPGFGEITQEEISDDSGTSRVITDFVPGEGIGSTKAPTGTPQRITTVRPDPSQPGTLEIGRGGTRQTAPVLVDVVEFEEGQPVRRGSGTGQVISIDPTVPVALQEVARPTRTSERGTLDVTAIDRGFLFGAKSAVVGEVTKLFQGEPLESRITQTAAAAVVITVSSSFANLLVSSGNPAAMVVGGLTKGALFVFGADVMLDTAKMLTSESFAQLPSEGKGEIAGLIGLDVATFTAVGTLTSYATSKAAGTTTTKKQKKVGEVEMGGDIIAGPEGETFFRPDLGDAEPGALMVMTPSMQVVTDTGGGGGGLSNAMFQSLTRSSSGQLVIEQTGISQIPPGTVLTTGTLTQPLFMTETFTTPVMKPSLVVGLGSVVSRSQQTSVSGVTGSLKDVGQKMATNIISGRQASQTLAVNLGSLTQIGQTFSLSQAQSVSLGQATQIATSNVIGTRQRITRTTKTKARTRPFPSIEFDFPTFERRTRRKGKAPRARYSPSLEAVLFNIRGKRPKILTGLEVRPL